MKGRFVLSIIVSLLACAIDPSFAAAKQKAKAPKPAFKIKKVTIPEAVQQGTPGFSIKVKLTGTPAFPVTMRYYPQACPKNPAGCFVGLFSFQPLVAKFAVKTDNLVIKNFPACKLINYSDPVFFDYAVTVKDKNGVISKPVVKGFYCTP